MLVRLFWCHWSCEIWKPIPQCLMWCIWRERNARSFEGCEQKTLELKSNFLKTLLEWMVASRKFSFSNLFDFIVHCNF